MSYKDSSFRSPFADITPDERRAPSWIAKHASPKIDVQSLRPAPLPREFVSAFQSELGRASGEIEETVVARRSAPPPLQPSSVEPPPQQSSGSLRAVEEARRPTQHPPRPSESFVAQLLQQQSEAATKEAKDAVGQALVDLANARSAIYEAAAAQLAELAATIARRVIAHELTVNQNIVSRLVDEGMRALEHQDRLVVRIGHGFEGLESHLSEKLGPKSEQVEVLLDEQLSEFGCIVETEHGWVDESIETRLATLLHELRADADSP